MASGIGVEFEELGMVGLIGIVLLPGVVWIANGKGLASTLIRTAVVGGLVAGVVALEATLDRAAEPLTKEL